MYDYKQSIEFLRYLKHQNSLVLLGEHDDPRRKLWDSFCELRLKKTKDEVLQGAYEMKLQYDRFCSENEGAQFSDFAQYFLDGLNNEKSKLVSEKDSHLDDDYCL